MGGERETIIKTSKTGQLIGDVRIHEKNGEVHFHLDKLALKVAVPVPRWFAAWEKLRTEPGSWCFYDVKRNTLLEVHTSVRQSDPADITKLEITVDLEITKAGTTTEFADLDKFTNG